MAFSSVHEMIDLCKESGKPLYEVILESDLAESGLTQFYDLTEHPGAQVRSRAAAAWATRRGPRPCSARARCSLPSWPPRPP